MHKKPKRAQSAATSAGTLIIIIALIIFLYIILLPPESREALLEGNISTDGKAISSVKQNETMLFVTPGTLEFISQKEISHTIPNLNLYSRTASLVLKEVQSAYLKKAWFDVKPVIIDFSIEDLSNTDNVLLSANIKKSKGKIIISLNGVEIYNKETTGGNLGPVKLPKEYLMDTNELKLESEGVGIKFWQTNEYELEQLKITGEWKDTSTLKSRNVFLVSSTENSNLEKATLRYFIDCTARDVGVLEININGHQISSAVPDCGSRVAIPFSHHYVASGENIINFEGSKGTYSIYQISIDTELKDISNPVYYFELTESQYQSIKKGNKNLIFKMRFVDAITNKKADLIFNSHITSLDEKAAVYERNIDPYIELGTNAVKIIPKTTLEIIDLRIHLEDD